MKTLSAVLAMLVISAALLCLTRKAHAEQVMGKRISDGQDEEKKRPFFVFLKIFIDGNLEPTKHCGGVLIDTDTVLSAARCFDPYGRVTKVIVEVRDFTKEEEEEEKSLIEKAGDLIQKVGSLFTKTYNTNRKKPIEAVSVQVYRTMLKPGYKGGRPDIARLKLSSPAVSKMEDALHPCGSDFWNVKSLQTKNLTTVGMGAKKLEGKMSDVLQDVELQVTTERDKCMHKGSKFGFYDMIDRFCAVGSKKTEKKASRDSRVCNVDEGGPVFNKDKFGNAFCLVGVLNKRKKSLRKDDTCKISVLFTSVEQLESWLANNRFKRFLLSKKEE